MIPIVHLESNGISSGCLEFDPFLLILPVERLPLALGHSHALFYCETARIPATMTSVDELFKVSPSGA